jgi:hypothetical protein
MHPAVMQMAATASASMAMAASSANMAGNAHAEELASCMSPGATVVACS